MTICSNCDNGLLIVKKTPDKIHYAQEVCEKCGKHYRWIKNPLNEGVRTKTSVFNLDKVKSFYGIDEETFCFFCLRTKSMLGNNQTFTLDHIKELSKGGLDVLNNIQILCTACHKQKNLFRLYFNWHYKEEQKNG